VEAILTPSYSPLRKGERPSCRPASEFCRLSSVYSAIPSHVYSHYMTKSGFLLIDKPINWTSFDIVAKLRSITGIKKIGHAGTLDPFATGLLIVAIGRDATKQIDRIVASNKTYEAEFVIGATTESLDTETEAIIDPNMPEISQDQIVKAMTELTGEIDQIPPMYSAIKIDGKRLYKLARKGEEIEREPRHVTIHEFKLINEIQEDLPLPLIRKEGGSNPELASPPSQGGGGGGCLSTVTQTKAKSKETDRSIIINVIIQCSSGTYVRALARDLAKKLGTVGYCKNLRRTKIGDFDIADAIEINQVTSENWQTFLNKTIALY